MASLTILTLVAMVAVLPAGADVHPDEARVWLERLGVARGAGARHLAERLIVLRPDGSVLAQLDGGARHVRVPADLDNRLRTAGAGLTLIHNHPHSTGLSADDLSQLDKPGVSAVVAVGHDGSMYVARRAADYPTHGIATSDASPYARARRGAAEALAGELSPRMRSAFVSHLHHVVATTLADRGLISYRAHLSVDRQVDLNDARPFLHRVRHLALQSLTRADSPERHGRQ